MQKSASEESQSDYFYGVIYPEEITFENWIPEMDRYAGKIIDSKLVTVDGYSDSWAYISENEGYVDNGSEFNTFLPGLPVLTDCLIRIKSCTCDTKGCLNICGCKCGAIKEERGFRKLFEERAKKNKRRH